MSNATRKLILAAAPTATIKETNNTVSISVDTESEAVTVGLIMAQQ